MELRRVVFRSKDPIIFTDEGDHSITYQSFDKAENQEEQKRLTVLIDKTPPEAKVFVDQSQKDLGVAGTDGHLADVIKTANSNTGQKDDAIYTISDFAGNKLSLDVRDRDREGKDTFSVYSIQYNQLDPDVQPKNIYKVTYKDDNTAFNVTEESFSMNDQIKLRIRYDSNKDQSTVFTKVDGTELQKEIKNGLVLLQLITDNGTLKYTY